ncbi:MAG: metal ABC transporter permease [Gemmataceae bacterium]|nr:metal ABC transporter permease [Gemmataceae bacterium]
MFDWLPYNTLVVLIGVALLGACSGVIGCFAVLGRRALVGDALSHATLPGVGVAYLLAGGKHFAFMLVGGFVSGLLGIGVLAILKRFTRIRDDAAIAIVLSTFYGGGIVLATLIQQLPRGGQAGWDTFIYGQSTGIVWDDVQWILALVLATLVVVGLLFKEFKLVAFDSAFAHVQGWPDRVIDFAMMLLLLVVVVTGLPAVGVLLMAAMLIVPASAARFWTYRLSHMLFLAAAIGSGSGVAGTLLSSFVPRPTLPLGPCIILFTALSFITSLLFAPERGLLARFYARRRDRIALLADLRASKETL